MLALGVAFIECLAVLNPVLESRAGIRYTCARVSMRELARESSRPRHRSSRTHTIGAQGLMLDYN
jgi:hypothetical protein